MNTPVVKIFTDGSCNPGYNIGGWAAILLCGDQKAELHGEAIATTHQRMELMAVIKSIEAAEEQFGKGELEIYTDSQYVARIPERMDKLTKNEFITKKGTMLPNSDLLQILINQIENHSIQFFKVKAHQRITHESMNNSQHWILHYNNKVDKMARKVVRDSVYRTYSV